MCTRIYIGPFKASRIADRDVTKHDALRIVTYILVTRIKYEIFLCKRRDEWKASAWFSVFVNDLNINNVYYNNMSIMIYDNKNNWEMRSLNLRMLYILLKENSSKRKRIWEYENFHGNFWYFQRFRLYMYMRMTKNAV